MAIRHSLSDQHWMQISDLFPVNGKRGGQWKDHRVMMDAIIWILVTGAPWRDLPSLFGPWKTVYDRFWKWTRNGFWDTLLDKLRARRNSDGQIDWELLCIDGSVVRAHKAAAGARKVGPESEPSDHALGRSKGGFGTKFHMVCDRNGHPIAFEITAGQVNECTRFESLMGSICVPSSENPNVFLPKKLAGDKAYSSKAARDWLTKRNITPVIASRSNEKSRNDEQFDRTAYRERNIIERTIGKLKESRRIATRYEKLGLNYAGMLKLGIIRMYLQSA